MYRLGDNIYHNKRRIRRICYKILYETEYDKWRLSKIYKIPDKNKVFIRDLLSYHPRYIEFDEYGEPDIFVDLNEKPSFLIRSIRGDEYRVALSESIQHLEKSVHTYRKAYKNARRNVRRQTKAFLNAEIERGVVCMVTSHKIELGDAEVHHVTPFRDLFIAYLDTIGMTPKTVPEDIAKVLDGWSGYHREHAVLCVLSRTAHGMIDKIPPRFQNMLSTNARKLSTIYEEENDDKKV